MKCLRTFCLAAVLMLTRCRPIVIMVSSTFGWENGGDIAGFYRTLLAQSAVMRLLSSVRL